MFLPKNTAQRKMFLPKNTTQRKILAFFFGFPHVVPPLRLNWNDMVVGCDHLSHAFVVSHVADDRHIR